MYLAGRIEGVPAQLDSPGALEAMLYLVASGLDAHFVQAGEALARAYDIVEKLIAALEGVTNALDREAADGAVANMHATADRLAGLPAVQEQRQRALVAIQLASDTLRTEMLRVDRTLDFLRICGLNIKVAAAGANGFSDFADTMFAKLDISEVEIRGIGQEVQRLAAAIPGVVEVNNQLAAECAKVIPQVPRKLASDALALQKHQADVSARAGRIADVARDIRTKVATAIGAMQIGDITRQRLEHVAEGRRLLDGLLAGLSDNGVVAEAIERQVMAMLAAQAAETIDDFHAESRVLTQSLRGIGPDVDAMLALRDDDPGDDGSDHSFLDMLEQSVVEVNKVTARLREADNRSNRLGAEASVTAESLGRRLDTIHRVTSDVQNMAWNTDLRCYHMGRDGEGLARVAAEIRGFVNTLTTISASIAKAFGTLIEAAAAIGSPTGEGGDAGEALAQSLATIGDGAQRMRDGMSGLAGNAVAVAEILHQTTGNIDCDTAFSHSLAEIASQFGALAGPASDVSDEVAGPLGTVLDQIERLYTMAKERAVHRRFVSWADTAGFADVAATADEDDDDGLF